MLVHQIQAALPVVVLGLLALYAIWPWLPLPGRAAPPRTIVLYGFSILGEAINDGVFPAFQEEWRERTGNHVELISSFAGSGTITNQIIMGVPAHLGLLSLELDAAAVGGRGCHTARRLAQATPSGYCKSHPIRYSRPPGQSQEDS